MDQKIRIQDYTYNLPEERIAKFPLSNRDDSKLLVYTPETLPQSPISANFTDIAQFLPSHGLMVFNETKVVPARLIFRRSTGALIEIFCLEPVSPADYQLCFAERKSCRWKAIVGNIKRWKGDTLSIYGDLPELKEINLKANLFSREDNTAIVEFTWDNGATFSQVMIACGQIPIPPYLKRDTQPIDYQRYQTIYALKEGSVAAPTAGLHFTEKETNAIAKKGIVSEKLCLHVGAGTFLPVKSEYIADHQMHSEPFSVSKAFLKRIIEYADDNIIAVGTTSTRCLESLYFLGVECIEKGSPTVVPQWAPYRQEGYSYSLIESITALINYLEANDLDTLSSRTQIIIVPGYKFRVINYLVTNFHQPQSTLLLLIAAFIGEKWRDLYQFALNNGFRFLSYGDSSLLQRNSF